MEEQTDLAILTLQKQHDLEAAQQLKRLNAYKATLADLKTRKQKLEDKRATMTVEMELGKETEVIYSSRVSIADLHSQLEAEKRRKTELHDKVAALFKVK